ncbi:GNAT family N-acetyltransferase [Paludibacterium purpuratum]|uniref:RimJ/RimL family protein N-acetyltransferase n=1 Tax=Paludibacterium purpuratum TaxID=1144873 RepID=A0A4R7B7E3_9NEIS|nr:GNAT family N-acetyltransferase [Paludibacterium purpuratum]TDR79685.1 RimJ/RimL family protein N-acetyltransferase [Paludibacterium purpuratum]
MTTPLESPRLLLTHPSEADIDRLFDIYGDPATNTFNPAGPMKDRREAEARMQRWLDHRQQHGFCTWSIRLKRQPDAIIGFGGLHWGLFGTQTHPNLGYRFATSAWGQGLATEFARYALKYGFTLYRLAEIRATVREPHQASRRVLEKIGMHEVARQADPRPGIADSIIYRIEHDAWIDRDHLSA